MLSIGNIVCIHFIMEGGETGHAYCEYLGKRNGKHVFESELYGWKYIVDIEADTVTHRHGSTTNVWKIDHDYTSWLDMLP